MNILADIPISSQSTFLWLLTAHSAHRTHFTLSGPDSDNRRLVTFEMWTERGFLFILNQLGAREGAVDCMAELAHCVFLALSSRKTIQAPSLNATVSSRRIVWPA